MKSVVIASGKGGTGKTTLTALFAHLAARSCCTVLVDADVEGSNLPIALGVEEASCEDFKGGAKATVDTESCKACGACQTVCRFGAILRDEAGVYVFDQLSCEGCGACARVCKAGAIKMETGAAGSMCAGTSSAGRMSFGSLLPGEDLSGKLVTEVRRLGLKEADDCDADLLLIDGPPGVGCPAIAALADTDLLVAIAEPTVSGVHDLARLAELAYRFDLGVAVILNKADLSAEGADWIREFCAERGLPLIAEIPYAPDIAALPTMRFGWRDYEPGTASPGMAAVVSAWRAVGGLIGVDSRA